VVRHWDSTGDNEAMDGPRAPRHIRRAELSWFDFDPTDFVERAGAHAADYPGLDRRLAACRRAAWQCDCYLALADAGEGRFGETAILWEGGEDLAVDVDRAATRLGSSSSVGCPVAPGPPPRPTVGWRIDDALPARRHRLAGGVRGGT
jgi:hypothetical protein